MIIPKDVEEVDDNVIFVKVDFKIMLSKNGGHSFI